MRHAKIIVAYDIDRLIGTTEGVIPWCIREDMKLFSKLTTENTVIMGRKTWDSLPDKFRPLPNRVNVVLTRGDTHKYRDKAFTASSMHEAFVKLPEQDLYVIGGGEIYVKTLQLGFADEIIATRVRAQHSNDGCYFPELDLDRWYPEHCELFTTNDDGSAESHVQIFRRRDLLNKGHYECNNTSTSSGEFLTEDKLKALLESIRTEVQPKLKTAP